MGKRKERERRLPVIVDLTARKQPRLGAGVPTDEEGVEREYQAKHPVWSLARIDLDCEHFGWRRCAPGDLAKVVRFLQEMERKTWAEVHQDRRRNHACQIAASEFSADARRRLASLDMDDEDTLFRFRRGGTERIWGRIRKGVFEVLWWDPLHKVWPVELRNT